MQPKRQILNIMDMAKWKKSKAFSEYLNFITNLNESVRGTSLSEQLQVSPNVEKILNLLETLSKWIDEIPPIQQPQRFGNKAFREWIDRLKKNAISLTSECLLNVENADAEQVSFYLIDSFGNETRIDYGTGHEMNFLLFLMCLFKLDALKKEDSKAVINKVFERYLVLVRKLQKTYNMEPAGSHGVWSLDDFQFLPFVFGSSQLSNHPKIEPRHFVQPEYIEQFKGEFLFFGCLDYITSVKHGPFAEHSNQLWNISGVPSWSKVNSGLLKMYAAEVLEKFPVVQHILFGNLIEI